MGSRNGTWLSLAAASLFILTPLVFAPSHVYLTNPLEFHMEYFELLGHLTLAAIPTLLVLFIGLAWLPAQGRVKEKSVAVLFAASALIWFQGNVMVWDYGLLTGGKIYFNPYFLVANTAAWSFCMCMAIARSAPIYRHSGWMSCVLIATQILSLSFLLYQQPEIPSFKKYELLQTNKFVYSKNRNVIILLLDGFQSGTFQKIINEDKSFEDIFDGFVYFRDAASAYGNTHLSVLNIMTGQYFDNSVGLEKFKKQAYLSSESLPKALKQLGFEVEYYGYLLWTYVDERVFSNIQYRNHLGLPDLVELLRVTLFRYAPDTLKGAIYNNGKWLFAIDPTHKEQRDGDKNSPRISATNTTPSFSDKDLPVTSSFSDNDLTLRDIRFISDMMKSAAVTKDSAVFKYYHLKGAHRPSLMNEKIQYEAMPPDSDESHERQAKGCLRIVEIFLGELKRLNVFDSSMIFIIADHGDPYKQSLVDKAAPLFLIKKFSAHGKMTISDAPVALSDIRETLFSELGLKGRFNGTSVFDLQPNDKRSRRYLDVASTTGDEFNGPIAEYQITGKVSSSDSWKAVGHIAKKKISKNISGEDLSYFIRRNVNIISKEIFDVSAKDVDEPTFRFGEGWSADMNALQLYVTSDVALITINARSSNTQAAIFLQFKPLDPQNSLSVYLNGTKMADCENCENLRLANVVFNKGGNVLEFRTKKPASKPGSADKETLRYRFSQIRFSADNAIHTV